MLCENCRSSLKSTWTFCPECGETITQIPTGDGTNLPSGEATSDFAVKTENVRLEDNIEGATGRSAAAASYIATESEGDYFEDNCADNEGIEEHEMVSLGETEEFQIVLEQSGYKNVMTSLLEKSEEFKRIKIKVAIVGAVGSGKSSLIKALMGLKDGEEGAATTSRVEEMMEATCYSLRTIELWDLPGVGSQNFPNKHYLEKVPLKEYDLIILVSSAAFTTLDAWLATQIMHICANTKHIKLFFVRTRVDDALRSKETGLGKHMTDEEKQKVMETIKEDCLRKLAKKDILDPNIFLVNNHNIHEFDFGEFSKMLITQVSALKREALILSLNFLTKEIVPLKIEILRKRIAKISKQAAMAAVISKRGTESSSSELLILKKEVDMYMQQLAVDKQSVEAFAHLYKVNSNVLYSPKDSLKERIELYFKNYTKMRETEVPSMWYELPLLGKWLALKHYQKQSYFFLKTVLNICVRDNYSIFGVMRDFIRMKTKTYV